MISYLERHNVPWQIIVTKSDKVPAKQLAKRITIMKDNGGVSRKAELDGIGGSNWFKSSLVFYLSIFRYVEYL